MIISYLLWRIRLNYVLMGSYLNRRLVSSGRSFDSVVDLVTKLRAGRPRNYSSPGLSYLWHPCPKWHAERFPWHTAFTDVPIFFIPFARSASPCCGVCVCVCVCVYIHTHICVETVYELPLVLNNIMRSLVICTPYPILCGW